MCDLICDVINYFVWGCNMGKINVYDKIDREWKPEKNNIEIKEIFAKNIHLKDCLEIEFAACLLLRQPDARGSADIIYSICDAYRYFAGQA